MLSLDPQPRFVHLIPRWKVIVVDDHDDAVALAEGGLFTAPPGGGKLLRS